MAFGDLLQHLRVGAEVSLRDLGKAIGLSPIYLSDIERGNRRPPSAEVILRIASHLKTDSAPLLRAALGERHTVEFELSEHQAEGARGDFMLALARVWNDMEDEAFEALKKQLENERGPKK